GSREMSGRGTGVLLAVMAGLVGYLWLVEVRPRRGAKPAPAAASEAAALLAPSADVARLELEGGGARLTAVRRDDGWADQTGRPGPPAAVPDLLDTLRGLRPIMVVDAEPEEPADYGLGPDDTRLRLLGPTGAPLLALEVGERNPAWTGLYARIAGRRE